MYSYLLLAQLVANTDRLSEVDKSPAYTEPSFCFAFARMAGKERVINTDTVLCIALMTLSGIPVGNDIQGGR